MKFTSSHQRPRIIDMEITSMVDVVFLLIIFFMTTAQFAQETRAELDLARQQGEQREQSEEAGVIINILADGSIVVNDRPVESSSLNAVVREHARAAASTSRHGLRLTIRADRNAAARHLNDVVRRLREAEIDMARIATEPPN